MFFQHKFLKKTVSYPLFSIILSLFYALSIVLLDFVGIPETNMLGFISIVAQWCIVSVVSTGIVSVLSANKYLFFILFPVLLILSVVEVYYRLTIGSGINGTTIEIAINNNSEMWISVITFKLVCFLLLALALGVIIGIYRWKNVKFEGRSSCVYFFVVLIFVFLPILVPRIYGAVSNRMPYAIYSGIKDYIANYHEVTDRRDTFEEVEVAKSENSPDVIVVLGESLRPDHLPMNGYERNTMPLIAQEENLISLTNIRCTGSHTSQSLPFIMTRADSLNPNRGYNEQSFITLFKKAGYSTSWIANQDIGSSYAYFAHEPDTLIHVNSLRSLYSYDLWLDTDVIKPFADWRVKTDGYPALTIIHSIGSHWWYKSHYSSDDAVYKPELTSKELSVLEKEQIINSYDNTIIATDRFLKALIDIVRNDNVIIIYISDHGEALGEDGIWLHGTDCAILHDVACLVWYSNVYETYFPEKIKVLKQKASVQGSSDDLFYSIIDAGGLRTDVLIPEKSIFYE